MARPRKDQNAVSGSKPREFKFATDLGKLEVPDGYVGRWVRPDKNNLDKKLAEGFEFVNSTNCPKAKRLEELGLGDQVEDGSKLGGVPRYREMVGMMLPADLKESRDEQINERTYNQMAAKIYMKDASEKVGPHAKSFKPQITID